MAQIEYQKTGISSCCRIGKMLHLENVDKNGTADFCLTFDKDGELRLTGLRKNDILKIHEATTEALKKIDKKIKKKKLDKVKKPKFKYK